MTKILFEKYGIQYREKKYHAWTRLFNTIEEVIKFMEENKEYVLAEDEMLVITSVEEAMKLAEKEHKNKRKKKDNPVKWLDKKIEEKEASNEEIKDIEAILSKYE